MLLGWAWGVIVMKAALATRPAAVTAARTAALVKEAEATGVSTSILVYNGWYLDTRVVVTYFCMLGLWYYLLVSTSVEFS